MHLTRADPDPNPNPVCTLLTDSDTSTTPEMATAYGQRVRDSYVANVKNVSDINVRKMEATRVFWQSTFNDIACTCNACGAAATDNIVTVPRTLVLVLPEYPVIIETGKWLCNECEVSHINLMSQLHFCPSICRASFLRM